MANVHYKRFKQGRQVKKGYKTPQIPPPRNNQGASLQMSPSVCGQKDVSKRETECNRRKGNEMDGDREAEELAVGDTAASDPGYHGIQCHVKD